MILVYDIEKLIDNLMIYIASLSDEEFFSMLKDTGFEYDGFKIEELVNYNELDEYMNHSTVHRNHMHFTRLLRHNSAVHRNDVLN